jgi:CMP-N,N'-diacetyllegionaminic acid synthase
MLNNKRILAIVPARAGSKGLPDKNIKNLGGKPLLAWPIIAALQSRYVDNVVLSTDSESYAKIGESYGAATPFLRPDHLASDKASSIDVIIHVLDYLAANNDKYDYVLLLEPTSPLTEAADIDNAIALLDSAEGNATSVIGVSLMETQHPAFSVKRNDEGFIAPLSGSSFQSMPRRQDLHPVYALDGSLYLSSVEAMYNEKNFCHKKTIGMVFDRYKSLEVDDLLDFVCIEAVLKHRGHQKIVDKLPEEKK